MEPEKSARGTDEDPAAAIPTQFLVGALCGGLGGCMDSQYIEPFGLFFGGTLAALQILDYNEVVKFPWNPSRAASDVSAFVSDNVAVAGGFAAGYFVGYNILDWMPEASPIEENGEGSSSSSE